MIDTTASRRQFLATAGLAGGAMMAAPALAQALAADAPNLAEQAAIWGLPLVLSGRYFELARQAGLAINRLYVSPALATPATHAVGPNIDTLYGLGWLDLAAGPQVITVPDTQDRYYSLQLLDVYGNSFGYIGRRATGTKAGAWAVTGPGWQGTLPDGVHAIAAPTSRILVLVRTLVRGERDLPAALAIHTGYATGALANWPQGRQAATPRAESLNVLPLIDLSGAGASYFTELDALVRQFPPLPEDAANLARFGSLGLGRGITAAQAAALAPAVAPAVARVRVQGLAAGTNLNGWRTNLSIVPFIGDPLLRAANNLVGPGAHTNAEALYFSARQGPDGQPLTGAGRYRLRFAPGQTPPVDGFWSLILYDKQFFLFDNPDHRYSFNDRSEGLVYGADGSLEILIGADRPAGKVNWLPAPHDTFQLIVRFYQPKPAVIDGTYRLPALERLA